MLSFLCPRALTSPSPLSFASRTPKRLIPTTRCLHQRAVPSRPLSTTSRRPAYKTIQELRSHARSGPFSARAAVLFLAAGFGMIFYFRYEKARVERARVAEMSKGAGRPKVGGEFKLVDHEGRPFGDGDMKGGFSLVYFGFTHCPDICPEELDKMARMIDLVSPSPSTNPVLPSSTTAPTPSIGPITPAYPSPNLPPPPLHNLRPCARHALGAQSLPRGIPPLDHPDGDFVEAIGRQHSPEAAARIIKEHMGDWKGGVKKN
ncbi:protein sco1 [Physcia stellaris]|nr:protein sco1 [Physcia stellaris]